MMNYYKLSEYREDTGFDVGNANSNDYLLGWRTKLKLLVMLAMVSVFGAKGFAQTVVISSTGDGAFEGASFAADNWTVLNNTTAGASWVESTGATAGFTGSKCAYITANTGGSPPPHTYTNGPTARVSALYKDVTIPAGETQISLSFKYICNGESSYDRLQVWAVPTSYTPLNGTTGMTVSGSAPTGRVLLGAGATGYQSQLTWTTANITIPAAYAGTTFRLVFQWRNDTSGGTNPPIAIDDVLLTSSCTGASTSAVTALSATGATLNAATFTGATGYNFQYRVVGTTTWMTAPGNPYATTAAAVTGLTAATNYEFQVAAVGPVCNSWSSVGTFYTGYCIPTNTNSGDYISAFTTTGGITNVSTSGTATTALEDYTAQIVTAYPASSVNFTGAYAGGSAGLAIWIDWGNDLVFDASDRVYVTTATAASWAGSFSIPAGQAVGNYRMRVRAQYTTVSPPACGAIGYGQAEDYTFTVVARPLCTGAPTPGTASASIASICVSGTTTLSLSGTTTDDGISYQWHNSAGAISGAISATYTTPTLTASDSYYCVVTCSNSGLSANSNTVAITVNNPSVASTTPASRCGVGTVTLGATGSSGATLNWYAAATGGSSIGTGTSFTTPSISASTNYYVEASVGGGTANGGLANNIGTSSYSDGTTGLVFNVTTAFTLNSVKVYNNGAAGTMVITLVNSTGTVLQTSSTFNLPVGTASVPVAYVANLGWNIPVGTGYRLMAASGTAVSGSRLVRESSLGGFPYALGTAGSITGGYFGGATTSYYHFYDWSVSTGCSSARTMVTATVTPAPALTLSSASTTICQGTPSTSVTVTSTVSDYDTYTWTPSTGVSGSAASGYTFNPSATTAYVLTASNSVTGCTATPVNFNVAVNSVPTAVVVTNSNSTICSDATNPTSTMLTATGGESSVSGIATLGTGTSTTINTAEVTAFCNRRASYKVQLLYTAAELTALGINAGQITSASFKIGALGSANNVTNFKVAMGTTTATALTTTFVTGLTTVFGGTGTTYTNVVGDNLITFATPFTWDGTSNVVIELTHNGVDDLYNATTYYTATTGNTVAYQYNGTTSGVSTNRFNIKFGYNFLANAPMVWSPTTGLYTDAGCTSAYTGTNLRTVYAKPTATTTYNATATNAAGCPKGATTTVTVINCLSSQVRPDLCGLTKSMEDWLYVTGAVAPTGSTVSYMIEATNLTTNAVVTITKPNVYFKFSELSNADYGSPMSIRVKVVLNGSPMPSFGTACTVTVASTTVNTQVGSTTCGTRLGELHFVIPVVPICKATSYTVEVSRLDSSNAVVETVTYTTPTSYNAFALTDITGLTVAYDTSYSIRVKANTVNGTSNYGLSCVITTRRHPSLAITSGCNTQMANSGVRVYSSSVVSYGVSYRFYLSTTPLTLPSTGTYVTNLTGSAIVIDTHLNLFTFSQATGYVPNTAYYVLPVIVCHGKEILYGTSCTITSPATGGTSTALAPETNPVVITKQVAPEFNIVAYPNPFDSSYKLNMTTVSEEVVSVKVYDMLGKQVEDRNITVSDLEVYELGNNLPSGVYNVIVSQGTETKTIRVIKK